MLVSRAGGVRGPMLRASAQAAYSRLSRSLLQSPDRSFWTARRPSWFSARFLCGRRTPAFSPAHFMSSTGTWSSVQSSFQPFFCMSCSSTYSASCCRKTGPHCSLRHLVYSYRWQRGSAVPLPRGPVLYCGSERKSFCEFWPCILRARYVCSILRNGGSTRTSGLPMKVCAPLSRNLGCILSGQTGSTRRALIFIATFIRTRIDFRRSRPSRQRSPMGMLSSTLTCFIQSTALA